MTEASGQPPTAQGSLEKTPFVHLLVYMADRRVSGTLVLAEPDQAPGEEHAIYFLEGTASKFRTGKPIAHLGRVLFELGYLSEQALNESLAAIAGRRELHGEYLCRMGVIDRATLLVALNEQAQRKIAYLFGLPKATVFAFFKDANLLENWGGPELTPLEPLTTIWSAARARGDEPIVDATLARLGSTTLKLHEMNNVTRFGFSHQELAAIDLIRARPCSLSALVESGVVPKRTVELIVYTLLVTRHLDHGADAAPPVGLSRAADSGRPRVSPPSAGNVPLARVKLASRSADQPVFERTPVERARGSSPPTSGAAFGQAAASDRDRISSLPPSSPRALTPEMLARREAVLKRADGIDRENYFSMLGVGRDASNDELQAAYYALAKTWHPDRQPPELSRVREHASKVFARMSEAFETLSDPAKRKRYVEVMKGGAGTPEEADKIQQILDAASDFQRGEILWKKNDPGGAEQYILRAYKADPDQADYIALYAMLQLSKRPIDAPVDDLIKLCDRAIDSHERCERAYFCRALLKKRVGKIDAAMSDFRVTCDINPKNIDAAREVRLYEMRRARQSPERQSNPGTRRSSPPPGTKSIPAGRSSAPPRTTTPPPTKKEGGVLSGIGKLFKR